jgi:Type II secretion system protein C
VITARTLVLTPRTLYGFAGALALIGLGLQLAPARLPGVGPGVGLALAPQLSPSQAILSDEHSYAPVAAQNVFSQSRTPPTARFVPEGRAAADSAAPAPKPRACVFRLFGITATSKGAIALIDADSKIPGPELYRVGDRIGGAPITAITDSTVLIRRASGPLILRLPAPAHPRP